MTSRVGRDSRSTRRRPPDVVARARLIFIVIPAPSSLHWMDGKDDMITNNPYTQLAADRAASRALNDSVRAHQSIALIGGCAAPMNLAVFVHNERIGGGELSQLDDDCFQAAHDIRLRFDHQAEIAGRILDVWECANELRFAATLYDTPSGRLARASVRDGSVKGISIGYNLRSDGEYLDHRHIAHVRAADLVEISLVTTGTPTFPGTWAQELAL